MSGGLPAKTENVVAGDAVPVTTEGAGPPVAVKKPSGDASPNVAESEGGASTFSSIASEFYPKIEEAVSKAKSSLDDLLQKAKKYSLEGSLKSVIDDAKKAVNKLIEKAMVLKDETAEVPVRALTEAIVAANNAIEKVRYAVKKYDEENKVTERLTEIIKPALDKCSAAIAEVSQHTSEAASTANARLQGVNHGIRKQIASTAASAFTYVLDTFADLDVKYNIRDKAKQKLEQLDKKLHLGEVAKSIDEKAKSLDEKYDLVEKAKSKTMELDRISKGRLAASYEQGRKMATESMEYLQEEYDKAVMLKQMEANHLQAEAKTE